MMLLEPSENLTKLNINTSMNPSKLHGLLTKRELPLNTQFSENISLKLLDNLDAMNHVLPKLLPTKEEISEMLCHNVDAELVPGKSNNKKSTYLLPSKTFMEMSNPLTRLIPLPSKLLSSEWTCEYIELFFGYLT